MTGKPDLTIDCLVHDLNNVFQTIIDAADLIGSDPNWTPIANIILRSVEQGRCVVSSLAGQDNTSKPFAQLAEAAMSFSRDFVASIKGPMLEFDCAIDPGVHVALKASAVERVLVNLFLNAAQAALAAGHGGCCIRIEAREEDHVAYVAISDDGPGIPDDALREIFNPGFSTDRKHSGLGLHIVETLVGNAGGSVSAANRDSGGAIFEIRLPLVRNGAAAAQQQ